MKTNIFRSNMHKYGLKLHYKGWGINRDFPFIKRRKPPRARAQQPYSNKKKTLRFMKKVTVYNDFEKKKNQFWFGVHRFYLRMET